MFKLPCQTAILSLPAAGFPSSRPFRERIHDELAIRKDDDGLRGRGHFQTRNQSGELHAVVGCPGVGAVALFDDRVVPDEDGSPAAGAGIGPGRAVGEDAVGGASVKTARTSAVVRSCVRVTDEPFDFGFAALAGPAGDGLSRQSMHCFGVQFRL